MSDGPLRRVGALWKPKPGGKSLGSGSITVNGLKQKFVIFRNDRKRPDSNDPDYNLVSSEEPQVDGFANGTETAQRATTRPAPADDFGDIPF
jgi:hypothetical protein